MNKNQKIVLISTAFLLLVMLLFPPFLITYSGGVKYNLGYSFILSPPNDGTGYVDVGALAMQFFVILFIGMSCFLLFKEKGGNK